jgi:hypothetical protein
VFVMGYNIPDWHDFLTPGYVLFTPLIGFGLLRVWEAVEPRLAVLTDRYGAWTRVARGLVFAGGALLVLLVMMAMGFRDARDAVQVDWDVKARTLIGASEGREALFLMPYTFSAGYYYGYSLAYYAYIDHAEHFTTVPPYDLTGLPLGKEPLYRAWQKVEPMLSPAKLEEAAADGSLSLMYLIDPDEPRFKHLGLLPMCVDGRDLIAGYQVVAVKDGAAVKPLVDEAMWAQISLRVVFQGDTAKCP